MIPLSRRKCHSTLWLRKNWKACSPASSLASDELDALSPASEKQDGIKAMDTDDTDADRKSVV